MKKPMMDKTEVNIEQTSFYINLLEMVQEKTKNNLTDYEEQMLINTVSELKLNLINENKKASEKIERKKD